MRTVFLSGLFLLFFFNASAQVPPPSAAPSNNADTVKVVEILSADRYGFKKLDSLTELLLLVGNVALKQGNTLFYGDSAVYNRKSKVVEAFRNVHINDNDTIDVYSDYLLYHTDTKIALLTKKVRLTDGKSNLYTDELEYDVNQKVGIYRKGGRVVNGTSTLTSTEGTYYADIKDAYFKNNVDLVDPQYKLKTDSLLYNTNSEIATFITKTYIEDSAKRTIVTSEGYYDLKNKNASFGARPVIHDGAATVIANQIDTDDNTGISILTGNAVYRDTAQGISLLANSIVSNKVTGSLVATQKPLMIIVQDKDSTFITADTLYSGRLTELQQDSLATDSLSADSLNLAADSLLNDSLVTAMDSLPGDSLRIAADSLLNDSLRVVTDSLPGDPLKIAADSLLNDSLEIVTDSLPDDSLKVAADPLPAPDSLQIARTDTASKQAPRAQNDSADRFFRAYHNVKIFSDSLQAVCDSLFYSGADSIFRLFRDPIVWSGESQVTGDTIYMQTRNKKPHEMFAFENGLMVNRTGEDMYNQIRGTRLFGYFKEGEIDYVRARGNAESIYYAKDEEERLIGINKASSDVIEMRFKNKELNRVVFINEVNGSMLPFRQATEQDKKLRNFKWRDDRRPKSRFELFGN